MKASVVSIDVREDLALGRPPCSRILQIVSTLRPRQQLRVIAPFQPTPLLDKLADLGFQHIAAEQPDGSWEILFGRDIAANQVLPLPLRHND